MREKTCATCRWWSGDEYGDGRGNGACLNIHSDEENTPPEHTCGEWTVDGGPVTVEELLR